MMRRTGFGTSLMLIALGAVLAFAVSLTTRGIDLNTVGVILMIVGFAGLVLSFIELGELEWFGGRRDGDANYTGDDLTPPHLHRSVDNTDIVYENGLDPHTERISRVRR